jgi:hypothetical protein
MRPLLTFTGAGLLALSMLAGCDKSRGPESSLPASSAAPSSSSAAPSSSSAGTSRDPEAKTGQATPAQGDVDARKPEQRRDYER